MNKMSTDFTTFTLNIDEDIAHIELSRPEAMNSMIPEFWRELPQCINDIDAGSMARVIVISSSGKHFSAGMDLSVFSNMAKSFVGEPARRAEKMRRMVLELQESFTALEKARMPVLAAVQGGAVGGALDMICACDMRYCTQDAFFTIKETELGMTADVGTLQRIGNLMPDGIVRELAYTGRRMTSTEAHRTGLINSVFESQAEMMESVFAIAHKIAANSPMAVHGCKEMLNYARDHSVHESLNYMATWQSGMFQMPDIMEAMKAAQENREAEYEPLFNKTQQM